MLRVRCPSAQISAVVLALAERPGVWRYGNEVCRQLDLKPGTIYPILMRLTDRGLLETTWDADVPSGRPPRAAPVAPSLVIRPGGVHIRCKDVKVTICA